MKRDSSGRLFLAADVARVFGVTPAAVRQWASSGRFDPDHVSPGGVAIWYADRVLERKAAVDAFRQDVERAKVNRGLAPPEQFELQIPPSTSKPFDYVVE